MATQVQGIAQTHTRQPLGETHAFSIINPMVGGREMMLIKHIKLGVPIPVNLGEVVNFHIDDSIKINDTRDYSMPISIGTKAVTIMTVMTVGTILDTIRVFKGYKKMTTKVNKQ